MLWNVFCSLSSPLQKVFDEFWRKGNPSHAVPALSKSSPKFLAIIVNELENNNNTQEKVMKKHVDHIFLYKNNVVCIFVKTDRYESYSPTRLAL